MLQTVFGMAPQEAVDFLRQKGFKIGFDHREVWRQEHQAAFTVAKAMQIDLLEDIRARVDKAIEDGIPFEDFKKALQPNLMRRGWWGKAMMVDPVTGQEKLVQLGSPRRLKVIYDTNLRQAHSEGQWERIQAVKAELPYLMYDHTPSPNERKEHAAWDGKVLRADDPWWQSHMPVRAWGCKCRVIQMEQRQLDRLGLKVSDAPAETYTDYTNKRTGETQRVPAGVDPEFNYPPGGRRSNLVEFMAGRIERLPADLRPAAVMDLARRSFEEWAKAPAGDWPIGVLRAAHAADLELKTDLVRISAETIRKQIERHPEISAAEYRFATEAIQSGRAILEPGNAMVFLQEEAGYVTVVKATKSGRAAFLTSFRRLSSDAAKRDREIARLLVKGKEK
jgi:hypothetical protein